MSLYKLITEILLLLWSTKHLLESNTQHTGLEEQAGMPTFDGTHLAAAIIAAKWLIYAHIIREGHDYLQRVVLHKTQPLDELNKTKTLQSCLQLCEATLTYSSALI